MFTRLLDRFSRVTFVFLILAVLALALPRPVSAAVPLFSIVAAKADESVTVRARDFPADVNFTVRMDVAGNLGIDGIVVSEFNSGKGGSFDATYRIPAELAGKKTLAIRFESAAGYTSYNWFNNRTFGSVTEPTVPVTGDKPYIRFAGVKKNDSVTVEAFNFPANVNLNVRVGPFHTFFRDYVSVTRINTGSSGSFKFTVSLPDVVKDVEMVTVRLDGGGRYAFNAFRNVDAGAVVPIPVTGSSACQIVSATPNSSIRKGSDFDAVWTIKNTSSKTWDVAAVDFKFANGSKIHAYGDRFDLPQTVKPGETVRIIVDMLAPNTAGTYSTTWSLVEGSKTLCDFSLNVRVR